MAMAFGAMAQGFDPNLPWDMDYEFADDFFGTYIQNPDFTTDGIHYSVTSVLPMKATVMGPQKLQLVMYALLDCLPGTFRPGGYKDAQPGVYPADIVIPDIVYESPVSGLENTYCRYTVTQISCAAFANSADVRSVTIPAGVKDVRNGAFFNCANLESVTFQHSGDERFILGQDAFRDCKALKNIDLTKLSSSYSCFGAFDGCQALEEVSLRGDNSVRIMGGRHHASLKKINITGSSPGAYSALGYLPQGYDSTEPFMPEEYAEAYLVVPRGSIEAYREALPWSNFTHIVDPEGYAAVEENTIAATAPVHVDGRTVRIDSSRNRVSLYAADGTLMAVLDDARPEKLLPAGIYIVSDDHNSLKIALR